MTDAERETALIEEIQQIVSQYKAEVPGNRKAWPKAIKERVAALFALGLKPRAIARRTGLSYHTVSFWQSTNPSSAQQFKPVKVVKAKALPVPAAANRGRVATVTVAKRGRPRSTRRLIDHHAGTANATVTVTTPTGFVIEHLPIEAVMAWLAGGQ